MLWEKEKNKLEEYVVDSRHSLNPDRDGEDWKVESLNMINNHSVVFLSKVPPKQTLAQYFNIK